MVQRRVSPTFLHTEASLQEPEICLQENHCFCQTRRWWGRVGRTNFFGFPGGIRAMNPEGLERWLSVTVPHRWPGWPPSPCFFSVLFVMNSYEFMRTSNSQREMSAYHHDLQS